MRWARWEAGTIYWGGESREIGRGEAVISIASLAQACNSTERRVRTAIKKLEKLGFLTRKVTGKAPGSGTVVAICEYDRYRPSETRRDTVSDKEGDRAGTGSRRSSVGTQEVKKEKEGKEERRGVSSAAPEGFNKFWDAYPKKVSRITALDTWRRIAPSPETVKEILDAVRAKNQSEEWVDLQYVPNAVRWEVSGTYPVDRVWAVATVTLLAPGSGEGAVQSDKTADQMISQFSKPTSATRRRASS